MLFQKKIRFYLFVLLVFLMGTNHSFAQYGNEWIDYNKTYWKFRTGTEGIFRIPKAALDAAGIPASVKGSDFVLYRDGHEIPLFASSNLVFTAGDYLEFYGYPADGFADKELYLDPAKQADEGASLFSDTAAYFLTYDNTTTHLSYTQVATPVPGTPPLPPLYRWQTLNFHGRDAYLAGKSTQKKNDFQSSQFDMGEGFIDVVTNAGDIRTKTFSTPNRVLAPVNAILRLSSLAYNFYDSAHHLRVSLNGVQLADSTYGPGDMQRFYLPLPATTLGTSNTLRTNHYNTAPSPDVYGLAAWSLEYPADFNVSGQDYTDFTLDASATAQYLEFSGFNHGGVAPKLYDLVNRKWYTGDISVSGKTRFYVDASLLPARMILYAVASPKIYNLSAAKQLKFTNYGSTANQGNYIIVSHRNFIGAGGGRNYIADYKAYRSSANGGAYSVVVADIDELYDQFAYGIDAHPVSIRHFLDYAVSTWSVTPAYAFLIGKPIILNEYRKYQSLAASYSYEGLLPAYGNPGSDVDFVNERSTWKMKMMISRLPAWHGSEIGDYLEKVKGYEAALAPAAFPSPATELWKKQVLHIAGSDGTSTPGLQASVLLPTLNECRDIISAAPLGARVTLAAKNSKGLPTTIEDKTVDSLISNGVSMITYYGHGSAFKLEYDLKKPSLYNTLPKVPFFSAFGCDISDIFGLDEQKTVSEEWVMAPNSGAIVSLGPSTLGFTSFHSLYMPTMYHFITANPGQSIGMIYKACNDSLAMYAPAGISSSNLTHLECYILQGDPAVRMPHPSGKPDLYVDNKTVSTTPVAVTTAADSFRLNISCFNLGRYAGDTVKIRVEHRNPAGSNVIAGNIDVMNLLYADTVFITLPINKTKDIGLNRYRVTIDPDNRYDEVSEANNVADLDVFIYADNIVPVYPENFSIVYKPELILKASTLNVFRGPGAYLFEIDTTELFNSPARINTRISSRGGVISWKPALLMNDSTVYYWRCSIDSQVNGAYNWAYSSFVYLKNGSDGWNQSHYHQYLHNTLDSLEYGTDRKFSYQGSDVVLKVTNGVLELPAPYKFYQFSAGSKVQKNGGDLQLFDCYFNGSIQIIVLDSLSGAAWVNPPGGRQGSKPPCGINRLQYCFSFPLDVASSRNDARKFLDSIPNGYFVLVKNVIQHPLWHNYYVNTWQDDTLAYGSGKSLYHSLRNMGFNKIDSFYRERPFAMFCRKGSSTYPVQQYFGETDELIEPTFTFPVKDVKGKMNSVVVGPAAEWKTLKWRSSSIFDTATLADSSSVKISGINAGNTETLVYEGPARDMDLAFISAVTYSRLKLQWFSRDTQYHSAAQLDYWRILYDPLPEAALNPAALYSFTDSVNTGQQINLATAIATLNDKPMDSMLVRYKVIDANGVTHSLADKRYRKLAGNDTLHALLSFDPKPYPGKNYLFVEANPDQDQKELYHPNNLGYLPFIVKTDELDPIIDVTFDGQHILDRDIISSKPFIKVLLKDDNKYLALKDTSTMKLFLRYPSDNTSTRRRISFDGSKCRFIPADMSGGKNEAYIEFRPEFFEDGMYQLYVSGEDASGNPAGNGEHEYSISFEVVNKASISNLLNYPNPFSTATAFVFTLTGWQVPSQLKIQVLTVTGKVVREITKQELGPIRIGRNVTEYKWDGRDQFGQELGNGVYLYRVVTSLEGKDMEHRSSGADRFYKNGYSKMYIMR